MHTFCECILSLLEREISPLVVLSDKKKHDKARSNKSERSIALKKKLVKDLKEEEGDEEIEGQFRALRVQPAVQAPEGPPAAQVVPPPAAQVEGPAPVDVEDGEEAEEKHPLCPVCKESIKRIPTTLKCQCPYGKPHTSLTTTFADSLITGYHKLCLASALAVNRCCPTCRWPVPPTDNPSTKWIRDNVPQRIQEEGRQIAAQNFDG